MAILDTKSLPLGNLQIKLCDALHHGHFGYKNHYLWEISRLSYVMLYIMAILHYRRCQQSPPVGPGLELRTTILAYLNSVSAKIEAQTRT